MRVAVRVQLIPLIPTWADYTILLVGATVLFVYLAKQKKSADNQIIQSPNPALSPNKNFDAKQYFQQVYYLNYSHGSALAANSADSLIFRQ